MRTGSPSLWRLASSFDVVPAPADDRLARLLAQWWQTPRIFGCEAAAASPLWLVVLPSPAVWCGTCGLRAFQEERRCTWCHQHLSRRTATALHFEFSGGLLWGRAHARCQEAG